MKKLQMLLCLLIVAQIGVAETTLELLHHRAESGDATAQTLLGLMTSCGYQIPHDTQVSREWYQRAADQGDSFAKERMDKLNCHVSLSHLSKEALKNKITATSSVEVSGGITLDDLALDRDQYLGKVVSLEFKNLSISTCGDSNPSVFVRGSSCGGTAERLLLGGKEALRWAIDFRKQRNHLANRIYVLVEETGSIALGTVKNENGSGYSYSAIHASDVSLSSDAEFAGRAKMKDLFLNRDLYLGKVIELEFKATSLGARPSPYINARANDSTGLWERLSLKGEEAVKWGLRTVEERESESTVYALVEETGLTVVGNLQEEKNGSYTYSWITQSVNSAESSLDDSKQETQAGEANSTQLD